MPLSLREAQERTGTVDVYSRNANTGGFVEHTGLNSGDLIVKYRVISGTAMDDDAKLSKALAEAEGDPEQQTALYAELITHSVISWDLSEEPNGPPIPITTEALRQTPGLGDILPDVIEAIAAHKRPASRKNGKR
jgi:hypothetical protein